MSERLALFRRAFNRTPGDVVMATGQPANARHNSQRAWAHWRQVMDKVILIQQVVGLEESVNSWLPSEVTGANGTFVSNLLKAIGRADPYRSD